MLIPGHTQRCVFCTELQAELHRHPFRRSVQIRCGFCGAASPEVVPSAGRTEADAIQTITQLWGAIFARAAGHGRGRQAAPSAVQPTP